MTEEPRLIHIPPEDRIAVNATSVLRVAIVSDEGRPTTAQDFADTFEQAWEMMRRTLTRRTDLQPKGAWALGLVDDEPENWRRHINEPTRTDIEKALAQFPEAEVVAVIGLFDTDTVTSAKELPRA